MLLENARIGTRCNARWSAMEGDDRVRFCGECRKNVYNLSALPRAEAERLLQEREGRICIRLYKRADGTVMTADCPVGVRRLRVRRVVGMTAGLGAAVLAVTTAVWRRPAPPASSSALITAVPDEAAPSVTAPRPVPETTPDPPDQGVEQLPELAPPPPSPQPRIAMPRSHRRPHMGKVAVH
jgi:hypothetical protein